ncbi:MAG: hypothetical protein V1921_02045 [Candidatus Altiarchaeota archaeon]
MDSEFESPVAVERSEKDRPKDKRLLLLAGIAIVVVVYLLLSSGDEVADGPLYTSTLVFDYELVESASRILKIPYGSGASNVKFTESYFDSGGSRFQVFFNDNPDIWLNTTLVSMSLRLEPLNDSTYLVSYGGSRFIAWRSENTVVAVNVSDPNLPFEDVKKFLIKQYPPTHAYG